MATIYLNPLSDFGFKRLFGTEPNKDLLIALLNALLPNGKQLVDLEFRNPEWVGQHAVKRKALFDLYCVTTTGERIIIELQRARQHFFRDRCLFYSTFPIQEQANQGTWNYQLLPVYVIALLDFELQRYTEENLTSEKSDYLHIVELKDQHGHVFYDKYLQLYVELPRFRKTEVELATETDKWLYFLRNAKELTARPEGLVGKMFDKIFNEALAAKLSPSERKIYEEGLKNDRDLRNMIITAQDDGKAIGIEQGEVKRARAVALMLIEKGHSVDFAAEISGLSEEYIGQLLIQPG